MPLTREEAEEIVRTGKALKYLQHFVLSAYAISVSHAVGREACTMPDADDIVVAGVALESLCVSPPGRKLLGSSGRSRVYKPNDYDIDSAEMDVAIDFYDGTIDQAQALKALRSIFDAREDYPDDKTLKTLLFGLVSKSQCDDYFTEILMYAVGWDGTEADEERAIDLLVSRGFL